MPMKGMEIKNQIYEKKRFTIAKNYLKFLNLETLRNLIRGITFGETINLPLKLRILLIEEVLKIPNSEEVCIF